MTYIAKDYAKSSDESRGSVLENGERMSLTRQSPAGISLRLQFLHVENGS